MRTITAKLRPQIEAMESVAAPAPVVGAFAELIDAEDVRAKWETLDVRQRREVVALLLTATVLRSRPGRGFDPASVAIAWKG